MYQKIMSDPAFTYEGAAQAFGIKGKVICGFPGIGKSALFKELKDSDYKVLDSDSSTFPKSDFPNNYIKHIKDKQEDGYTILASSHDVVRDALLKEEMMFTLVYPDKSLKKEYLKRYADRGSQESFIKLLDSNWDKWITQCDELDSKYVKKVKLGAGEFIDAKKAGLVTTLKESEKTIKTQKEMISDFKDQDTTVFKKTGTFDARKGKAGELIVTTIDGEDETKKTVKDGEIVVKGPKGEMYVISETKFRERYEVDEDPTDSYKKYKTKGLIRAYEYKGNTIKFMASWDEEMLCKSGDYLATPISSKDDDSVPEVYRIERSVFDETYKPLKDD
ncbi:hypothetical protein Xoosp13_202 [Xanthomonas phage Xoo-sp13]|nr:hypothetical protein Xoosp13_202 [Xanthomonas phage Xoo-sp13]